MSSTRDPQTADHQDQLQALRQQVQSLEAQLRAAQGQGAAPAAVGLQLTSGQSVPVDRLTVLQRQASIGAMTALLVHEFNNILTPMINYAALAKQNPDLTEKALHWAEEGGNRASKICMAIQAMYHREVQSRRSGCLEKLARETVDATARPPEKDHIDLAISIPANLEAAVPAAEVQLVLLNLYTNARRAVLQAGGIRRILVTACRQDGQILPRKGCSSD